MTMGARPPQLDGDDIAAAISNLSRTPFREVLGRLIEAEPSVDSVQAFAEKYPDRWAQSIAIMGRLSGFNEKLEVDTNIAVTVSQLSDSQLLAKLSEISAQLKDLNSDSHVALPSPEDSGPKQRDSD